MKWNIRYPYQYGFEPVGEVLDEKWDRIFDINTKGVMRGMRKAIPIFLEKEKGVVINIASTGEFTWMMKK